MILAPSFTPDVWTRLRTASAESVSFDGTRVLYRVEHGVEKGPSAKEWWTVSVDGTGAIRLRIPKGFTPSGFTHDDGLYGTLEAGDTARQIAVLPPSKSAPVVLTDLPQGVGNLTISPDGRRIATLASDRPKDPRESVRTVVENDVSTPYVVNVDGSGGAWWCRDVTSGQEMAWSPDGGALAVLSQVGKIGQRVGHHDVRGSIDRCTRSGSTRIAEIASAASIAWIDGGKTIAFVSTSTPTLTPEHVYTVAAGGGTPVDRTPDLQATAFAAAADVRGDLFVWVLRGVQGEVDRFVDGALVPIATLPGGSVEELPVFSPFAGASERLAFTVSDPTHADNVAVLRSSSLARITHEGDALLAQTALGRVEVAHWMGPQTPLTGIVTFPPGYVAGKKYPFVNVPHGGPEFNDLLDLGVRAQMLAARGYVVMQPEYRGSTGVNSAFTADVYQHFGDRAFADVDSATDYAVAQGWADPHRLGMFGWSAGGFMTAWTLTQTQRYRAAVEGAGITDLLSFIPTSDIAQIDYDARSHIADPQVFLQFSPIMFADRVTTPLLILHGDADLRVPTFQGREYFIYLRELGKTARMVTYPGSPHFPRLWEQRRNVYEETFDWFDRYL